MTREEKLAALKEAIGTLHSDWCGDDKELDYVIEELIKLHKQVESE